MILNKLTSFKENSEPLRLLEIPVPKPKKGEVLIKVGACGVCHTEIDEIEGRTPPAKFPVILGHQVVGRIVENGEGSQKYKLEDRVGVGWIYSACGKCCFCLEGNENLCDDFLATGRDVDGGYAEFMIARENFIFPIPKALSDAEAAPLLCAGAVGFRSLKLTGLKNGQNLGLTGFGASGHLVLKMAKFQYPDSKIYVFARSEKERQFALKLGATWAGDTIQKSPQKLHCIIDTTPVWKPVVEALKNLEKGGKLVINAIRKEDNDKEYLLNLS
ncbi:MAG: alcohol dehydrogenase catalytic domain-containing protein, partial [Gillisia sp.]